MSRKKIKIKPNISSPSTTDLISNLNAYFLCTKMEQNTIIAKAAAIVAME
ncbi:unnamed protein product [marine sediment metagenome]|uniref:Uncharacterized protein n=1 Tax=marine sediment metagenome TaxID=412755 RepID=X1TDS6_9ZZZZ